MHPSLRRSASLGICESQGECVSHKENLPLCTPSFIGNDLGAITQVLCPTASRFTMITQHD